MGLLTDPSLSQSNPLGRNLVRHNRKICFILYFAGLIWFCCLGHKNFNHKTYFSENALSPGLVYSEIRTETTKLARSLLNGLNQEREYHTSGIPYSWISAKMQQMGLEIYQQNFTLNYPLGSGKVFQGKNIYGIHRAPRIGSTEGIVFSTPYRPPDSVHPDVTPGVAILLAFADFARKKNYWAKDLIFLITDQEQLGMHAWLEGYYKGEMEENSVLHVGTLEGKAGALQAALNIEIQDLDPDYVNVKIEGLNGQLPNSDMFNLVQLLAERENLPCGYKQTSKRKKSFMQTSVQENVQHMVSMILSQTSGVPSGNHGLFHRYRIESLTLEAIKKNHPQSANNIMGSASILRTIEGISRSLNNLLERFHQGYFFYILVADDRFISIGDFMPCLMLMAAVLLIKAFLLWISMDLEGEKKIIANVKNNKEEEVVQNCITSEKVENKEDRKIEDNTVKVERKKINMQYFEAIAVFGVYNLLGLAAYFTTLCRPLHEILAANGFTTETIIFSILLVINIIGCLTPIFLSLNRWGVEILHVGTLLHLGCSLIVIGLLNFSLGFVLAIFITPLAIILDTRESNQLKSLSTLYTFLLNPLIVVYCIVFILTLKSFPELVLSDIAIRAGKASMDALAFSVVDFIIYTNWLFPTIAVVLFPSWVLLWNLSLVKKVTSEGISEKLKDD